MNQFSYQFNLWPDKPAYNVEDARIRKVKGRPGFIPIDREFTHSFPLVLASEYSSKINVLRLLGLIFTVDSPNIDEDIDMALNPEKMVRELARRKANAISVRYPKSLVLGADTVIVQNGYIIGKPKDRNDAHRVIAMLSGKTHEVITGLTIEESWSNLVTERLSTTRVTFRPLSNQTIRRYIATKEPFGKAGSYAIQGAGSLLVEKIEGEYSNVLGLPIATFVDALADLGYELI